MASLLASFKKRGRLLKTQIKSYVAKACHDHGEVQSTKALTNMAVASSSSSSSSSSYGGMVCDICEVPKTQSTYLFEMLGCAHLLCQYCLSSVQSTEENPNVDEEEEEEVTRPCPIPGCHLGFFLSDTCATASPISDEASPATDDEIYCGICMESKSLSEGFMDMKGCSHIFCCECIAQYVVSKVEENVVDIRCPDTTCTDGVLELEACRPILDPQAYHRWGAALCELSIAGPLKFYCPYKDCSALVLNDENVVDTRCPHCQRKFCAKCKVPWHSDFTCNVYQKLRQDERSEEDLLLMKMAKNSRWQRCPNCGYFVERTEGCVFIKCRCNHCFCYLCASKMDAKDNRHYCSKCNCVWDTRKR